LRIRIHLIRIQHSSLNTDPDPDPIRIQGLDDQKLKKFKAEKKFTFFYQTTIYLSLGIHKERQITEEAFSPQKRTSSTSKHEISKIFLLLWVIFSLLDPDPDSEVGYGSTDLIGSGSETLNF
jgi:hypothetical protein